MSALPASPPLLQSDLRSLQRLHQGKVRDIYEVDDEHMLIVTTDRLSAFDVVLPDPIPGKGSVLTRISRFWFDRTRHLIGNHLTDFPLERAEELFSTFWRQIGAEGDLDAALGEFQIRHNASPSVNPT